MYRIKGHQEADGIESYCFVSLIHFDTLLDHGSRVRILCCLRVPPTILPFSWSPTPGAPDFACCLQCGTWRWLKILNLQDRSANTKCDQCCGRLGSLIFEPKDYGAKFEYQKIATFSNKWQNWFTYLVPENFGGPSQVGVLSGKGCDMKIPAAAKVLALNHRVNSQAWPCGLQCQCTFCLRDDVQYYATRF